MFDDISLVRMVISRLAETHGWTYEESFNRFYNSKICKGLSDKRTVMFTFAPREIIEVFEQVVKPEL